MDTFEAIHKRYSHKEGFLPDPIPLEHLERIAHAGLAAPTGNNSQFVKMVILPDRAAIARLCKVNPTIGLETAPAAIAVFTDPAMQAGRWDFQVEDYAAACAQMLIAATALGYASLWLDSPYFDTRKQKEAVSVLKGAEGYYLRVVVPIGLPDGEGSRREKIPYEQRIFYGTF